jgi:hypothetical protein
MAANSKIYKDTLGQYEIWVTTGIPYYLSSIKVIK